MLQLAIECSGIYGSVTACESDGTETTVRLPTDQSSVQSLAKNVKSVLANRRPTFISVTNGPGSFTGLRVGITTAKMLSLAWNLPIVAVDTLQVLAHQIAAAYMLNRQTPIPTIMVVPSINAFRKQVFTSVWLAESNGSIVPWTESSVVDASTWIENPAVSLDLSQKRPNSASFNFLDSQYHCESPKSESRSPADGYSLPSSLVVGGPGLLSYQPLATCCPALDPDSDRPLSIELLPELSPDSKWVAQIGWQRFRAGEAETANSLCANYVRQSAAEEKLNK